MEEVPMETPDYVYALIGLIPFAIYFLVIIFLIYFFVKGSKFMKAKIELDRERNLKMDELIKIFSKNNHIE